MKVSFLLEEKLKTPSGGQIFRLQEIKKQRGEEKLRQKKADRRKQKKEEETSKHLENTHTHTFDVFFLAITFGKY